MRIILPLEKEKNEITEVDIETNVFVYACVRERKRDSNRERLRGRKRDYIQKHTKQLSTSRQFDSMSQ